MSKKVVKTNACRLLDQAKVAYETTHYDVHDEHNDGVSVAAKLGVSPEEIYKTLVMKSDQGYHVCLVAANLEVNLKLAAKAFGVKKIEMIPQKDLLGLTGYVKGGCSPIGMKKHFPTVIDEKAKALSNIYVSAGMIGLQLKLAPLDLANMVQARFVELTE